MSTPYIDKNGAPVCAGSILKYDEGVGYSKAIHLVLEEAGELCGAIVVGEPLWSLVENDAPISLWHYCGLSFARLTDAEVIGHIDANPEMLTPEYAAKLWPDEPTNA